MVSILTKTELLMTVSPAAGGFGGRNFSSWENDRQLRHLRKLSDFVRLADIMLITALVDNALDASGALQRFLCGETSIREASKNESEENALLVECSMASQNDETPGNGEATPGDQKKGYASAYTRCGISERSMENPIRVDFRQIFHLIGHETPAPIFYTFLKVGHDNGSVELNPKSDEWAEMIHNVVQHIIQSCNEVQRVVSKD